jgi:hypothetical protein
MPLMFSGPGVSATNKLGFGEIALASGQTWLVSPAGNYEIRLGKYTILQYYDQTLQTWRAVGGGDGIGGGSVHYIYSDGTNFRLANLTGCVVGALLTNHGSSYTSAPTVTASAGGSLWRAVLGGLVNTSVTVSNGGTNYTYPPTVLFSTPPAGGIPATGYCTLSGGAVSTVTVTNQGGGYTSPPTISFVNDPREGINNIAEGYNAAAVCTLTGSGTIAGVICIDPGSGGQTSVPTLSFSGGGGSAAAATAIMCWTITAYTPTAGTGFTGPSMLSGLDAFPTTAPAYTNPSTQKGWVKTRNANILMPESGGAPTATGAVFYDGGIYTSTPTSLIVINGALITQTTTIAFTMGGVDDTSYISS